MSIVRAPRPDHGFLVVSNDVLRDDRLSYRALGVLLSILSRPDNWSTSAERLARKGPDGKATGEGRQAMLTVLRELHDAGYVQHKTVRGLDGRLSTTTYVFDTPQPDQPESVQRMPVATRGNDTKDLVAPESGEPGSGQPDSLSSTEVSSTEKEKLAREEDLFNSVGEGAAPTPPMSAAALFDVEFREWYETYPKHVDPGAAERAYRTARKRASRDTLLAGARVMAAAYPKGSDKQFCKGPGPYLNARAWENEEQPEPVRSQPRRVGWEAN